MLRPSGSDVITVARVSLFATRLPENIKVMGRSSAACTGGGCRVGQSFRAEDFISEAWTPE